MAVHELAGAFGERGHVLDGGLEVEIEAVYDGISEGGRTWNARFEAEGLPDDVGAVDRVRG